VRPEPIRFECCHLTTGVWYGSIGGARSTAAG
jgi:hypothetical protein